MAPALLSPWTRATILSRQDSDCSFGKALLQAGLLDLGTPAPRARLPPSLARPPRLHYDGYRVHSLSILDKGTRLLPRGCQFASTLRNGGHSYINQAFSRESASQQAPPCLRYLPRPAAPASLPSPALCLAGFVAVFTVITVVYALLPRVSVLLRLRRERLGDVEAGGRNSTVVVDTKVKARISPQRLIKSQNELAAKMRLASVHKELMGYPTAVLPKAPKVAAVIPGTAAFLKSEARRPTAPWAPGHLRQPLGASPLRVVYTAPPPPVPVGAPVLDIAPKYQSPIVAPTTVAHSPKPVLFVSTPRTLLLANLAAATADDADYSFDYSVDEESVDLDGAKSTPALSVELPLRDSRLRNLWKAAANPAKAPKILDRRKSKRLSDHQNQHQNKENLIGNSN
ncbi:hypothetical protein FB45DRAFT_353122 [Roridomyces roridus]|uniref:Uncharacterized protein n=1 Tax=Roridomyces roridus TaxID=1738132 RepID=A0AAD7C7D9_9AGAR|nr:hypothetical protein FB45DRAFT_353122 [Roridomyces roridus]